MNSVNQKIIDAVITKAERVCPNSLALIGVYGSVATGDEYAKSDLDLLILIQDDEGWQLGTGFILEDSGVGYDIYCTNWDGLIWDAGCHHAQLSKLMDSKIIYVKNDEAAGKLNQLREQTKAFLQSEERFGRVDELLQKAKTAFADACLHDQLGSVRLSAADVILSLLDAIMLWHGRYFRRGTKRIFEELAPLHLSAEFLDNMRKIASSSSVSELRSLMRSLILFAEDLTRREKTLEEPSKDNISGTYEEMYSNWRNKVEEAASAGDVFSAFLNMCSLQWMIADISSELRTSELSERDIMAEFDAVCLENNVEIYDEILRKYEKIYQEAGISVKRFRTAADFAESYLKTN